MNKFIHSDNLVNYYKSIINSEFASLTPDEMLKKLVNDVPTLDSTPPDVRQVYTSRDAAEVRNYLISLVQGLTDEWTDFNESDIGVTLIELLAGVADMLGFYLDRQALECYITDVKQRKNGAGILKLINYNLHPMSSARTTGLFTLPNPYSTDILIPRYTQVSANMGSNKRIYYATTEDVVIPAGTQEAKVALIQGEVHNSSIKVSELKKNRRVDISTDNIAEDSMIITIDGLEWTRVPDVLIDDVPGAKYSVFEDKNCKSYIYFHDKYLDYLPSDDSLIAEITFLVTLGKEGQITDGMIDKVVSPVIHSDQDISSLIEVSNIDPASGGSDRETLDEARIQAPKTLSMLGKAITLQDFQDLAEGLSGVVKCKAIDWSVAGDYVSEPYLINLYVVPTDGYVMSSAQADYILDYFEDKKVNYQKVSPLEPKWHLLDLAVEVDAYVNEANKSYLANKIADALREELAPSKLEFGMTLQISDIKSIIRDVSDNIATIRITNLEDNIYLKLNEFIRLGYIHVLVNSKKSIRQRI